MLKSQYYQKNKLSKLEKNVYLQIFKKFLDGIRDTLYIIYSP